MGLLKKFLENKPSVDDNLETIAYLASLDNLQKKAPRIAHAIIEEIQRQRNSLKLIASENYSSLAVQLAMGNLLTDKYAEGHPHHRFYAGCENIDTIEAEAVSLAKTLFEADHAYVQPHSGADANLVAFWGILIKRLEQPALLALEKTNVSQLSKEEYEKIRLQFSQQKLLGMALDCGGHLTHGSRANVSSKMFQAVSYGLDHRTHLIDYKEVRDIARREKPAILLAGYSAYPRLIDFSIMREIADEVGATFVVDMAHFAGLVAGKVLKGVYNPILYADVVTSTSHKTLRGPRGGFILCTEAYKEFMDKGCPHVLGGPLPHVMAAKALAFREALDPSFSSYAEQIVKNAKALAQALMAKKVHLITNGTDNHLVLIDVQRTFGLSGRAAENLLSSVHMTANRNSIPQDPNGPWYCAGIRLGTAALTTRGMKEQEMEKIATILYDLFKAARPSEDPKTGKPSLAKASIDEKVRERAKNEIAEMLSSFPLYPEIVLSPETIAV
ncbi:MAG: glycine hydroxymethyltransferase [Verrucomicrobia bacterium]|nr:glycine hydroxymethyltransferase [Verrucomicrobiota bacterium]